MITTRNLLAGVATAALIAGAAGAASANFVITPGPDAGSPTFGSIPEGASNQALDALFGGASDLFGFYGATIDLSTAGTVTVDFLGSEAGFDNSFLWEGDVEFSTGGNTDTVTGVFGTLALPLGSVTFLNVPAGELDFAFGINGTTTLVTNAANPDDAGGAAGGDPNFFASFNDGETSEANAATSGAVLFLFLDDGGGSNDDNHDDMVMRLTFTADPGEVAEPVTLGILGLGLAGIGLMARRRRLV